MVAPATQISRVTRDNSWCDRTRRLSLYASASLLLCIHDNKHAQPSPCCPSSPVREEAQPYPANDAGHRDRHELLLRDNGERERSHGYAPLSASKMCVVCCMLDRLGTTAVGRRKRMRHKSALPSAGAGPLRSRDKDPQFGARSRHTLFLGVFSPRTQGTS